MRILIAALILLSSASIYAQQAVLDREAVPFNATGTVKFTSPIRDAPPHGPFNLFLGEEIKSTYQDQKVKIVGKKTYNGFKGTHIWYQLESADNKSGNANKPWWVYGGLEGETPQIKIDNIQK